MGKFEKGQYVRCVNVSDTDLLTVGKVYKVDAVNGGYIDVELDNGSVGGMWSHRFEAWQPKVGERVRVTYGHGWEGEGTVDRLYREVTFVVNMETGKFSGQEGGFSLADLAPLAKPTTLTIEAGKFYKTRDGRKVGPMKFDSDGEVVWGPSTAGSATVFVATGMANYEGEHVDDLIAEWVDEPTAEPAAQPAKASNDNAEPLANPKFKVGDRVKLTTSRHGESQLGKTGVVINDNYRGGDLTIEIRYDTPMPSGLDHNQYSVSDLELVAAPASTPAIVALIENGTAKPSTRPKVHSDQASATTEAERLALEFPGQQFGVFVLADSKIADVVNVPTAILRAA